MAGNNRIDGARSGGRRGFSIQTFASLSNRNVRSLFIGRFFTSAGNWIQAVTLGYLAYSMTGNPVVVGTLLGARSVPWLVVGPLAGVMIDRLDRLKVLLWSQVLRVVIALVLGIIMLFDLLQVWHLYAYIILNGVGWVLDNPTRQAIAAASVPQASYQNALALIQLPFAAGRIVFPIIGGVIIAITGSSTINIFIQAVSYTVVFFMYLPIKLERPLAARRAGGRVMGDLVDGARYAFKEPAILGLIIMGLVPSFFLRPFEDNMLGKGATGLGILMSCASAGSLTGTVIMASFTNVRRKGRALIITAVASGIGLIFLSQTDWMGLAIVFLFFVGMTSSMYHLLSSTMLMTITPDHYRGRVTTLFSLDQSGAPLGGLLAGALALWLEVEWSMLAGGITTVVLVLVVGSIFKGIHTTDDQPKTAGKEPAEARKPLDSSH